MQRKGLIALVLLVLSVAVVQCKSGQYRGEGKGRFKPATIIDPKTLKPVHHVIPREWIMSAFLRTCFERMKAQPNATSAVACNAVFDVDVWVKPNCQADGDFCPQDDSVTVNRPCIVFYPNECIRWILKTETVDPDGASFNGINFFDTAAEASAAGKTTYTTGNPEAIGGDICPTGTECIAIVATTAGTYGYQIKVKHGGRDKMTDPDIVVSCTGGTSCDGGAMAACP